jgi:PAS domain-containing protein
MILRLLRAKVKAGEEARLERFIREDAVGPALQTPGLLSFQPATRETPEGLELLIASTWVGFDDLLRNGRSLDEPLTVAGAMPMLGPSRAEHFELVIGEALAMPLRAAKLRLTRIPIVPGIESTYYATVRQWADRLLDEHGMVAFSLGRRVSGRQDEIAAVQVFEDEEALQQLAGDDIQQPIGQEELSRFWAAEPSIEHFDALTATEARPSAPAILLADDDRRYVHATPAAAVLTGRPLARLLTMRVEDVAPAAQREAVSNAWQAFLEEGSADGPFVLERPDGSALTVRFAAKRNAPWPGSHASLLVPTEPSNGVDEPEDLDIDQALVEAGLVARYATT